MVDNSILQNKIADILEDMDYIITFDDIRRDKTNRLGIYLTDAGDGLRTFGAENVIQIKDLGIRIHGGIEGGSKDKCNKDMKEIARRLNISNCRFNGLNVLSCSIRNSGGKSMGVTSKGIPVYDIHFLIQYN